MYAYTSVQIILKYILMSTPKYIKKQNIGKNNQYINCFIENENNKNIQPIKNPKSNMIIRILNI